ncbi:MAG TPA: hypothetical protein PLU53_13160 [Bacteroidia bacterium]|nr:hypothetical protein [Bacteroidia bacterium]
MTYSKIFNLHLFFPSKIILPEEFVSERDAGLILNFVQRGVFSPVLKWRKKYTASTQVSRKNECKPVLDWLHPVIQYRMLN